MTILQEISDYLASHGGFEPPDLRTIRKAVSLRLEATGEKSEAAYRTLLSRDAHELAELINLVVVPETFFFRYPSSFRALVDWSAQRAARPVRILSLSCSTGEEPYSAAMALLDAGFAAEDFVIEARDLSTAAIAASKAGLYGGKSFREIEGDWKERYFVEEHGKHRVIPRLAKRVEFRVENLLHLEDVAKWDVIFCRNSLIYFALPEQRKIAERISRALVSDGIIFVGPAEPPLFIESGWMPSGYGMSFSCVRRTAERSAPASRAKATVRSAPKPKAPVKPPHRTKPAPIAPVREVRPAVSLDEARALADAGRLEEAQAALSVALQAEPANAEAHFLQGVLEEARGRIELAEANYRKAIYLQPGHAEALQHMALLARSQGRGAAANHFHRRASRHTGS